MLLSTQRRLHIIRARKLSQNDATFALCVRRKRNQITEKRVRSQTTVGRSDDGNTFKYGTCLYRRKLRRRGVPAFYCTCIPTHLITWIEYCIKYRGTLVETIFESQTPHSAQYTYAENDYRFAMPSCDTVSSVGFISGCFMYVLRAVRKNEMVLMMIGLPSPYATK